MLDMFSHELCSKPGCHRLALSRFNEKGELTSTNSFCLEHYPNLEEFKDQIIHYFSKNEKIVGLSAYGMKFDNLDFSGKKFYGCNMQHCIFSNIRTDKFRSRISSYDFSIFSDCDFGNSNIHFVSLAGAKFSHVLFTKSDLIQNNFCGIQSYQSSFDKSNLYKSRFIRANLVDTSFIDCNVKRTNFAEIQFSNINFKLSNTGEAVFTSPLPKEVTE